VGALLRRECAKRQKIQPRLIALGALLPRLLFEQRRCPTLSVAERQIKVGSQLIYPGKVDNQYRLLQRVKRPAE